jgi:rhodanese-related sulfurtransferase
LLRAKQGRYIDTRNNAEFNEGHVPGATLIPYVEKSSKDPDFNAAADEFNVDRLGPDKGALLIFGCNGPECWKSHKASIAALKAGYTNVAWFRGGLPEWRSAGLPVEAGDLHVASP